MKKASYNTNPFEKISASMRPLFSAFEKFLVKQAMGFASEVRAAAREAITPKGKFIRPLLVFSAAHGGNCKKESLVRRAAIAELTHLSSLIHDDVLDNAEIRRNALTANKKYGARTAILLGDAIFAHTMLLTFDENDGALLKKTADCIRTICEGEIRQTLADKDLNVSKKRYYEIAYGKTAALFSLACGLGAMAVKAPKGWVEAAEEAGKQLGIAYQIYDDICDWFMSEADAGKTLGTDLASGKKTFPLIVLLEKLPTAEAKAVSSKLMSGDEACAAEIARTMRETGVPHECAKEFARRISLAEKAMAKYPSNNVKLLEFCAAMRDLRLE